MEGKSKEQILKELDYKTDKYNDIEKKAINDRLTGIVGLWQHDDVSRLIKGMVIPLFNKMKHKLMIYKKDDSVIFALEDIADKQINKLLEELKVEQTPNNPPAENIDWIAGIAEHFERAIQDLIVLRLFELGVKPEELGKLTSD